MRAGGHPLGIPTDFHNIVGFFTGFPTAFPRLYTISCMSYDMRCGYIVRRRIKTRKRKSAEEAGFGKAYMGSGRRLARRAGRGGRR